MIKKRQKNVGLIIKDHSISVVEVEVGNHTPKITNYAKILLEEGVVEYGCIILNKEGFKEAVTKLLASGINGPINTGYILVALPEEKVFSHRITIPKEKIKDSDYIKEAAKDFIPIELDQAVSDYKAVYEDPSGKNMILNFVAAQKSVAEPLIEVLKEINLQVIEINVNINCLIKSFHNSLNQGEGAFLLVNLELERDLLAINSVNDNITKIVSGGKREEITDKLKTLLSLPSNEEVQQWLISVKKGEAVTEDQKTNIKDYFRSYIDDLPNKIHQLILATQAQEPLEIKTIYLTGTLSALPGVEEAISGILPEIPIKKTVQFAEIPPEMEWELLEGIGLCINGTLPNDKNNFNLLPETNKEEINLAKISPQLKIFSAILVLLLMAMTVTAGISTARSYLNYKISSQEVTILNTQALNPYTVQIAKTKKEMEQSNSQILSLIADSVPASYIMRDLNAYNRNGVAMVNINYIDNTSGETSTINLRAKTINRQETEQVVSELENSRLYLNVESPLSNLVGKGERFISIKLIVDKASVTQAFEDQLHTETKSPGLPSVPPKLPAPQTETIINEEGNDV
ncbi:MAG: pilus assembly protein PilM [Patescibacteria group bacterium]